MKPICVVRQPEPVYKLVANPVSAVLASVGARTGTTNVWDWDHACQLRQFGVRGPNSDVLLPGPGELPSLAVAPAGHRVHRAADAGFSPDGLLLGRIGPEGAVEVSDWRGGSTRTYGHPGQFTDLAFDPLGGRLLASGCEDALDDPYLKSVGSAVLFDVPAATVVCEHRSIGRRAAFHPSGRFVVNVRNLQDSCIISFGDAGTLQPLGISVADWATVTSLAFAPAGTDLAYVAQEDYFGISVFDLESLERRFCHFYDYPACVDLRFFPRWGCVFDGSGDTIYCPMPTGNVAVFDARTGALLDQWMAHSAAANAIAVRPDVGLLFTGSADGEIAVWELPASKPPRFAAEVQRVGELFVGRRRKPGDTSGMVTLSDDERRNPLPMP